MPVVHMQVPLLHVCPVPQVTPAHGSVAPPATPLTPPPVEAPPVLETAPAVPGAPATEPLMPPLVTGPPPLERGEPALPVLAPA